MRILHIVPTYFPATRYGGPIYSVHGLCRALALRGHDVEVYTTNVDGAGVSPVPVGVPVDLDGVKVTYFPTGLGRRLFRSPSMSLALDRNTAGFDIVHLHSVFLWPTLAGAGAARAARVPYIVSPRGMLVSDLIKRKSRVIKSVWIWLFERRNIAQAATVHVTSQLESDELSRLGLARRRVDLIPNGFDLPVGSVIGEPDRPPVSPLRTPVVLSLGRISWKKGLDRLIQAMQHVPAAELLIAGNDEEGYQPQLEALALQANTAARVRFVGPVAGQEKWRAFADADVFALASYSENFGIAVLEAMAHGVPVVVTPEVGLAEEVRRAGAGLVVSGDPATFGAAIAGLLADPAERAKMGQAGRRAAAERFSWTAVATRTEAVYADLCKGAAQPSTRSGAAAETSQNDHA